MFIKIENKIEIAFKKKGLGEKLKMWKQIKLKEEGGRHNTEVPKHLKPFNISFQVTQHGPQTVRCPYTA